MAKKVKIFSVDRIILFLSGLLSIACVYILLNGDQLIYSFQDNFNPNPEVGFVQEKENQVRQKSKIRSYFRPIEVNELVRLGDSIFSGISSRALVRLNGGGEVEVQENSLVTFDYLQEQTMPNFKLGSFVLNVNGKAKIAILDKIHVVEGRQSKLEIKVDKDQAVKMKVVQGEVQITNPEGRTVSQALEPELPEPATVPVVESPSPEPPFEAVEEIVEQKIEPPKQVIAKPRKKVLPKLEFETKFTKATREQRRQGNLSQVQIDFLSDPKKIKAALAKFDIEIAVQDPGQKDQVLDYTGESLLIPVQQSSRNLKITAKYKPKNRAIASEAHYVIPEESKADVEIQDEQNPSPAVPIYPKANQVDLLRKTSKAQQVFTWRANPKFDDWELEIAKDSDFNKSTMYKVKGTKFILKSNLSSGAWYWRVRSYNTYVESPWSPVRSFTIYRGKR